jgi:hypothetical protein
MATSEDATLRGAGEASTSASGRDERGEKRGRGGAGGGHSYGTAERDEWRNGTTVDIAGESRDAITQTGAGLLRLVCFASVLMLVIASVLTSDWAGLGKIGPEVAEVDEVSVSEGDPSFENQKQPPQRNETAAAMEMEAMVSVIPAVGEGEEGDARRTEMTAAVAAAAGADVVDEGEEDVDGGSQHLDV